MIDGFKNREVVTMPMQYTGEILRLESAYRKEGSVSLEDISPVRMPRRETGYEHLKRDWDNYRGWNKSDDLADYLDMIGDYGEAEEGGNL